MYMSIYASMYTMFSIRSGLSKPLMVKCIKTTVIKEKKCSTATLYILVLTNKVSSLFAEFSFSSFSYLVEIKMNKVIKTS